MDILQSVEKLKIIKSKYEQIIEERKTKIKEFIDYIRQKGELNTYTFSGDLRDFPKLMEILNINYYLNEVKKFDEKCKSLSLKFKKIVNELLDTYMIDIKEMANLVSLTTKEKWIPSRILYSRYSVDYEYSEGCIRYYCLAYGLLNAKCKCFEVPKDKDVFKNGVYNLDKHWDRNYDWRNIEENMIYGFDTRHSYNSSLWEKDQEQGTSEYELKTFNWLFNMLLANDLFQVKDFRIPLNDEILRCRPICWINQMSENVWDKDRRSYYTHNGVKYSIGTIDDKDKSIILKAFNAYCYEVTNNNKKEETLDKFVR